MSVAVGPGWTVFTVLRGERSIATPRTRDAIAPFVIEQTAGQGITSLSVFKETAQMTETERLIGSIRRECLDHIVVFVP
jgi:hypothetical protein